MEFLKENNKFSLNIELDFTLEIISFHKGILIYSKINNLIKNVLMIILFYSQLILTKNINQDNLLIML